MRPALPDKRLDEKCSFKRLVLVKEEIFIVQVWCHYYVLMRESCLK